MATSAAWVSSRRATSSAPLVSLSSRCTMPARGRAASAGSWCSSALTSVPLRLPAPGCTTRPAGLFTTSRCSSSNRTSSEIASAWSLSAGSSGTRTRTRSPASTGSRGRRWLPSMVASPDLIQAVRREREYCGNSCARAWSKRSPASALPTSASRMALDSSLVGRRDSGLAFIQGCAVAWSRDSALRYDRRLPAARRALSSPPGHGPTHQSDVSMIRYSGLLRLLILCSLLLTAGCGRYFSKQDPMETLPVEAMYEEAKSSTQNGNYSRAARYYRRLIARFPYGRYTEQAQLELAYAQYKTRENEEAMSAVNRFIKTYPTNPHIDYAYYLRGLINFSRRDTFLGNYVRLDLTQRDQSSIQQSFNDFAELLRRYPNSRYAADTRQRMVFLRNQ